MHRKKRKACTKGSDGELTQTDAGCVSTKKVVPQVIAYSALLWRLDMIFVVRH